MAALAAARSLALHTGGLGVGKGKPPLWRALCAAGGARRLLVTYLIELQVSIRITSVCYGLGWQVATMGLFRLC